MNESAAITKAAARVGVPQYRTPDGYIQPRWPDEVYRTHRIYFVRAGEFVKVGFSTDYAERVKQLQTASPHELKVVGLLIGTTGLEAEIHRRLTSAGFAVRGEWFAISDDQVKWVANDPRYAANLSKLWDPRLE